MLLLIWPFLAFSAVDPPLPVVVLSGTIKSVEAKSFTMITHKEVVVTVTPTTKFTLNLNRAKFSDLKPGMKVRVTLEPDKTAEEVNATGR